MRFKTSPSYMGVGGKIPMEPPPYGDPPPCRAPVSPLPLGGFWGQKGGSIP